MDSFCWERKRMSASIPTTAVCCLWIAMIVNFANPATCVEPAADQPLNGIAVLDCLVGSWIFTQDGFSASQECKWILNRQYLEIDTHVLIEGQATSSWRTLIASEQATGRYRQWRFSDNGVVSVEDGAWNESNSTLTLTGHHVAGHDSESTIKVLDDNTIEVNVREVLDDKDTRRHSVLLNLSRVPPTVRDQLTK